MNTNSLGRLALFAAIFAVGCNSSPAPLHYPETKKVNQVDDYFGTKVSDPYRWLESDTAADTKQWVETERNFTEAYLSKIPYRQQIKKQVEKLFDFESFGFAIKAGDYIIFSKRGGLQNQAVFYYQKGAGGTPQVLLDPNTMSADGSVSVAVDGISNNKKYLNYHINRNGSDWSTGYIMDIASHTVIKDSISWMRGDGFVWAGNTNSFYYVRFPEPAKGTELTAVAKNPKVFYHTLGDNPAKDKFIYADTAHPEEGIAAQTTEDGKFLFIYKFPGTDNTEVWGKKTDGKDNFKLIFKGYDYQYNIIDNNGDTLIVKTNNGAGNFRVVAVNFNNPAKENWKEVIPEKPQKLESACTAGGKIFASYLENVTSKVYQYNNLGVLERQVPLPGPGSAGGLGGFKDDEEVYYGFTSFTYPNCIYRYDIKTGKSSEFKKSVFASNLDDFETEQVFYPSKDGTKVPMFLVYKKGLQKDASHPTLLYAYGGFDISITPYFWSPMFELLQNNGVLAIANIRGGGEYGEAWHTAGMREKKQTVFDDFIAAAGYLVDSNYTTRQKLAVMGGSNGGLLIGAVITQKPDMCQVAFPEVGVMDMLRFQKYTSGVFWTGEFGSSDSASQFAYLYKYSPLHNIKSASYPATLVMTADHDDRVVPMHSFKFAATMQQNQTGANPVLIRITTNQGHGASGSSLQKNIESWTDVFSFMFYNMGITPKE